MSPNDACKSERVVTAASETGRGPSGETPAPPARGCRMCGSLENLTKHHLLKKKSARIVLLRHGLTNRTVKLCRSCHNRFHFGPPEFRQAAWDELLPLLTDYERQLRDLRPILELWEQKLKVRLV